MTALSVHSKESLTILKLFGIDTGKTIEAHIHFVVGEAIIIECLQYTDIQKGHIKSLEKILKKYVLTDEKENYETVKIEKGIPLAQKIGRKPIHPFTQMKVGDSVLIEINPYDRIKHSKIACAARQAGKHKSPWYKFKTRKVENGVRIWRIL